ncbi:hypothetical protein Vretifemale_974, partial [Volvox reticuliferus]
MGRLKYQKPYIRIESPQASDTTAATWKLVTFSRPPLPAHQLPTLLPTQPCIPSRSCCDLLSVNLVTMVPNDVIGKLTCSSAATCSGGPAVTDVSAAMVASADPPPLALLLCELERELGLGRAPAAAVGRWPRTPPAVRRRPTWSVARAGCGCITGVDVGCGTAAETAAAAAASAAAAVSTRSAIR